MKRRIIYASAIEALAFLQIAPSLFMITCTNVTVAVLGAVTLGIIVLLWTNTKIGRWFLAELYRSTLRLEKLLEP